VSDERDASSARDLGTFTNQRDSFLHTMLVELLRLHKSDEQLDGLYCEAMAVSAAQYLMRRYGSAGHGHQTVGGALPGWRLRRALEYVNANLGEQELRLDDVARCVGLSLGFFHRAFKDTTGETPLAYIQRMRIQRAMELLASRDLSVLQLATKVGFLSPSHFSRLFQRQVGMTPSRYRQGRR
jgi:AraC family transcriptional regulator